MTAGIDVQGAAAGERARSPFHWLVQRELWEHRAVYLAPAWVAAVFVFGYFLSLFGLPRKMRTLPTMIPAKQHAAIVMPFDMAATLVIMTTFVVAFFYCLESLGGERRDRSILFWKSLPVSDRETVLSKVTIPMVVLPCVAFVISLAAQVIMLVAASLVLVVTRANPVEFWSRVQFIGNVPVMLYGIAIHALWFAPIYAWLLLMSVWAKRAALLWAVLPFMTLGIAQMMFLGRFDIARLLKYRIVGAMQEGFSVDPTKSTIRIGQLAPLKFLSAPGLWTGLLFAALCVYAAIRLRRRREPA